MAAIYLHFLNTFVNKRCIRVITRNFRLLVCSATSECNRNLPTNQKQMAVTRAQTDNSQCLDRQVLVMQVLQVVPEKHIIDFFWPNRDLRHMANKSVT